MKDLELINLCKTLTEDNLQKFEQMVMAITDLKASFGSEIQELNKESGNNKYMDEINCLEDALAQFMDKISDQTLAHLITISFKKIGRDSYKYTMMIVDYAIKNNKIDIQDAMAKAFVDAQEYYDPGHREWEKNVYEMLIDEKLKAFDETPLAYVLLNSNSGIFRNTDGDRANQLFYDYFAKATNKEQALTILDCFIKFSLSALVFDEFFGDSFLDKLKQLNNSTIANELNNLAPFFELYMDGFVRFDEEKSPEFLKLACNNIDLCKKIDWVDIYYREESEDFNFDYDLAYSTLLELVKQNSKASHFFFNFAYYLNKDALKVDMLKNIQNIEILDGCRHHSAFDTVPDEFNAYLKILKVMLTGKSEEEAIADIDKEESEAKEKEELARKNQQLNAELVMLIRRVKEDLDYLPEYIKLSENLAANFPYSCNKRQNLTVATSSLLLKTLQSGELSQAKEVFYSYVDNILPYVGPMLKITDVASLAIVLSILTKDDDIFHRVMGELLVKEFAIDKIDNNGTLYNLSCYYAKKEDKENMLNTVKLAVKHGKEATQFLNEKDFSLYHEDKEFRDAIDS